MKFSFPFSNCFSSTTNPKRGIQASGAFRVFSYNELKAASNGFRSSNKIGDGGFGTVYKGRLEDGMVVAIKVLSVELESMRGEREFISELAAMSNIKHEYLVKLHGCCVNGAERFLVYDYMENNSLSHTFLGGEQNRAKFSWRMRRDVSLGVARGLTYLNEEAQPQIIHRDIKASNILLDRNFTPKVSDFGLSKLFRDNKTHISTRVAGTIGYLAPEYAISGHLTRKSDVYSFGVLLLQIISGRSVVDFYLERGEQHLVDKAWEMYMDKKLVELVDPVLNRDFPEQEATKFLKIGLLCVQESSRQRPLMSVVVQMLTDDEIDISNMVVSRPGLIVDLMDVKIGGPRRQSPQTFFSKISTP